MTPKKRTKQRLNPFVDTDKKPRTMFSDEDIERMFIDYHYRYASVLDIAKKYNTNVETILDLFFILAIDETKSFPNSGINLQDKNDALSRFIAIHDIESKLNDCTENSRFLESFRNALTTLQFRGMNILMESLLKKALQVSCVAVEIALSAADDLKYMLQASEDNTKPKPLNKEQKLEVEKQRKALNSIKQTIDANQSIITCNYHVEEEFYSMQKNVDEAIKKLNDLISSNFDLGKRTPLPSPYDIIDPNLICNIAFEIVSPDEYPDTDSCAAYNTTDNKMIVKSSCVGLQSLHLFPHMLLHEYAHALSSPLIIRLWGLESESNEYAHIVTHSSFFRLTLVALYYKLGFLRRSWMTQILEWSDINSLSLLSLDETTPRESVYEWELPLRTLVEEALMQGVLVIPREHKDIGEWLLEEVRLDPPEAWRAKGWRPIGSSSVRKNEALQMPLKEMHLSLQIQNEHIISQYSNLQTVLFNGSWNWFEFDLSLDMHEMINLLSSPEKTKLNRLEIDTSSPFLFCVLKENTPIFIYNDTINKIQEVSFAEAWTLFNF